MTGKYDSFRDSALHYMVSNGYNEGEFGDVNDYGVYIWRITNTDAEVVIENTETTSLLEQWESYEEANGSSDDFREKLMGHFIISEDSQGFVSVRQFDSYEGMEARFEAFRDHYNEWVSEQIEDGTL
jgi:hypothetical protein